MTDKYRKIYIISRILSSIMVLLPISIYTIIGLINGSVRSKLVLGVCLTLAIIFVAINVIAKHRIRSTIWILLIGIYMSCVNIVPLLIIIAIVTIIDEFILEPLYKKYKAKYTINKEIDIRTEENGRE